VKKFIRFAAPYRSKTFNDKDALLVGRNGVMSGGQVTQSGGVVSIQPVVIVQNGQIVDIDVPLSANLPANMQAPYFVAVSISSPIEVAGELITPVFIKRPQDVNNMVVLVAEWDGTSWRSLPRLQIKERVAEQAQFAKNSGLTGVSSGTDVTKDANTFTVQPGTLTGPDGLDVTRVAPTVLQKIAAPVTVQQAFDRIDVLAFRKPVDSRHRIGQVKAIVGPTFTDSDTTYVDASQAFGSGTMSSIQNKRFEASGQTLVTWLDGQTLRMQIMGDDNTAGPTFDVATTVDSYSAAPNFDGSIDVAYVRGSSLFTKRVTVANLVVVNETQVYTSLKPMHEVALVVSGRPNDYTIHVAVTRELSGTAREIGYVRLASDGSVITPYIQWINLSSNLARPTFAKDDDDNVIFLAFENADLARAYLYTYDAASALPSAAPTQVGSVVELQTEVYNRATGLLMGNTGADRVQLVRTDNKELFAFWRHDKGSGQYGMGVYNARFKTKFGYKAYLLDDEMILDFSATVDGMNRLYADYLYLNGPINKISYNLETLYSIGTLDPIVAAVPTAPQNPDPAPTTQPTVTTVLTEVYRVTGPIAGSALQYPNNLYVSIPFTPSQDVSIYNISFKCFKYGPSEGIPFRIMTASANGAPGTTVLSQGTIPDATIQNYQSGYAETGYGLDQEVALTGGLTYVVVFQQKPNVAFQGSSGPNVRTYTSTDGSTFAIPPYDACPFSVGYGKRYIVTQPPPVVTQPTPTYSSTFNDVSVYFGPRGELYHFWANPSAAGSWARSTAGLKSTLREQVFCQDSDVYLAFWRASDDVLAVSDYLVGEKSVIKRLYDLNHLFGAAGSVSWAKAGTDTLVLSAITIRFFNRDGVYTIPATGPAGIVIPDGAALLTLIPDEDTDTTLTTSIVNFGDGVLDRAGKRQFPLFWNIGGRLFSNFSPYSFNSSGESSDLGGTISSELIQWLGSGSSAPDASDHGYNSTNFIQESDSIVTAIGKLDAAQSGYQTASASGLVPLASGTTSVTVNFGTARTTAAYRVVPVFENTTDADPMLQSPLISQKTKNGFTVRWNSGLDTNNYLLDYVLRDQA
jgi:hypothetical protein